MRKFLIAFVILAPIPAHAQTLTDSFGRTIQCAMAGSGVVCNSSDGLTLESVSAAQALVSFGGMAPVGWVSPAPPPPTVAEQAAQLLMRGIAITSTSTPALDGVYGIDAASQANINAVQTYILTTPGSFPTGATMPWVDVGGTAHVFTSTSQFTSFAKSAAQIAAQLALYGAGALPTAPAMSATIP